MADINIKSCAEKEKYLERNHGEIYIPMRRPDLLSSDNDCKKEPCQL